MKYEGLIYYDGSKPLIQNKDKFIEWLSTFKEDQWFSITVVPVGSVNNTAQQKLYHKWCDIMTAEFGWDSRQEMHDYLKKTYNNGESTKGFDVKQWSEYMIKVSSFANSNGINLPTGE